MLSEGFSALTQLTTLVLFSVVPSIGLRPILALPCLESVWLSMIDRHPEPRQISSLCFKSENLSRLSITGGKHPDAVKVS
jgi:hypothetical protein